MITRFVIRLQTGVINETALVSWHNNQQLNAQPQYGSLAEAIAEYKKLKSSLGLFVALPVSAAPEISSEISSAQKRKINQVLPFLFEEKIAEDVEDLHFSLNSVDGDCCRASYINKDYLDTVLAVFKKQNVSVHWLGADAQLLKPDLLDNAIVFDERLAYARNNQVVRAVPHALLNVMYDSLVTPASDDSSEEQELEGDVDSHIESDVESHVENKIDTIYLTEDLSDEQSERMSEWAQNLDITIKNTPSYIAQLASQVPALQKGNVLSGDYNSFRHKSDSAFPWKSIAAVAGFFIIAFSIVNFAEGMRYKSLTADVHNQQKDLYVSLFPDAKNARSNFKVKMQSKLRELGAQDSGDSEGVFAELFDKTSQIVATQQSAELILMEQARYNNASKKMDIVITAKSLGQLDTLKNELDQQGLQVTMGSVVNTDKGTRVKFSIGKLQPEAA